MLMDQFDPFIQGHLEGSFTSVAVTEPPPALGTGNLVIDPTKDFKVNVKWEINGALTGNWLFGTGAFTVSVFAESLGGGPEQRVGTATVNAPSGIKKFDHAEYDVDVLVPGGTLPESNPGGSNVSPSGIYKLAVSVFLDNKTVGPYDTFGFHEGPIVAVEDPA